MKLITHLLQRSREECVELYLNSRIWIHGMVLRRRDHLTFNIVVPSNPNYLQKAAV
jgi:hypothetical protein